MATRLKVGEKTLNQIFTQFSLALLIDVVGSPAAVAASR
jgi:hypothetical protein